MLKITSFKNHRPLENPVKFIKKDLSGKGVVCLLAGLTCISCNQNFEDTNKTCKCPAVQPPAVSSKECPSMDKIQLSQLDSEARSRLKSELLDEIKGQTMAQWRHEFDKSIARQKAQYENDKKKPENQEKPQKLTARPDPLPPTQKIERDSGGLKVLRQVFSTEIVHRLPVEERDSFSITDSNVFCFVEIASSEDIERTITIRFIHSTGLSQSFTLPVSQSPAWRTWSKLNVTRSMTGTWLCEVYNEDGALLASKPFVIVGE